MLPSKWARTNETRRECNIWFVNETTEILLTKPTYMNRMPKHAHKKKKKACIKSSLPHTQKKKKGIFKNH